MSDSREDSVWPPPPAGSPLEEAEPPPKTPRVTDQAIGRVSLGLSCLGLLGALACILRWLVDPNGHWPLLEDVLLIGSGGCFFTGFFVGLVGWHSWEGRVGLCLAVIGPPLWVVAGLLVDLIPEP